MNHTARAIRANKASAPITAPTMIPRPVLGAMCECADASLDEVRYAVAGAVEVEASRIVDEAMDELEEACVLVMALVDALV